MLNKARILAITAMFAVLSFGTMVAYDSTQTTPSSANVDASKEVDMKKVSEAFGHFIGKNLKSPGLSFDLESIIKGMRDGADGKPSPMTDQEYEASMLKVQEMAFNKLSDDNLKAAEAFLAKNAQDSTVKTLVPGKLQYVVITEGNGAVVDEHGSPSIKYVAKYIDGTVFDSSDAAGGSITIPLDQTIPGFSKGIAGMKEGEKRRLFVHPDLAYGKTGQLPPNSGLIFEVEVVKVKGEAKDSENDDDDDDSDESDDELEAHLQKK